MSEPGYKYLKTYLLSTIIFDLTVDFCKAYLPGREYQRFREQMDQAGRSGKQNIAEGSKEKSLASYIKLLAVALASLEELLLDYQDFLRQRKLEIWDKDHPKVRKIREFRAIWLDSNHPNTPDLPDSAVEAANLLITLISQAKYLLEKQIASLEEKFTREGGYRENLYKKRMEYKRSVK